jgi:oligopeptide transport system permease protein
MNAFARRLIALLITLLAVHAAAFGLIRAARGGPFDTERDFPPAVEAALRAQYHLDEPLLAQYWRSLSGIVQGDFGPSMRYRDVSVNRILAEALPVSLSLGLAALLLAIAIGIPVGFLAAWHRNKAIDRTVLLGTTLFLSIPNFVLAGLAISLFCFTFSLLPPAGTGSWRHLVLPSICLGLPFAAQLARLARSSASDVLRSDSVRTAHAKGLPPRAIRRRHVLLPALPPLLAFLGPTAAAMLTGSLVIEQVFALPGLGTHFVQAALNRDYTLALGITVSYTALLGLMTLLADWMMAIVDPRLRSFT